MVAAEVRELAQRSAEAAKQIRQLMEHSTRQMQSGQTLALQAGQRMENIVRDVHKVSGLIASITEAAQAQNQGIAQISEAVQVLDHMTSQNAGLVAESSAAARYSIRPSGWRRAPGAFASVIGNWRGTMKML